MFWNYVFIFRFIEICYYADGVGLLCFALHVKDLFKKKLFSISSSDPTT